VWPEQVPIFTVDDIIDPPPKEYEEGDKRSFIGWLKELFLYVPCEDNPDCIQITTESRKNYKQALDLARSECKIKEPEAWEETATRKAQAAALNKIRKKLGYTQETYI
jgi:hypothetical protein